MAGRPQWGQVSFIAWVAQLADPWRDRLPAAFGALLRVSQRTAHRVRVGMPFFRQGHTSCPSSASNASGTPNATTHLAEIDENANSTFAQKTNTMKGSVQTMALQARTTTCWPHARHGTGWSQPRKVKRHLRPHDIARWPQ